MEYRGILILIVALSCTFDFASTGFRVRRRRRSPPPPPPPVHCQMSVGNWRPCTCSGRQTRSVSIVVHPQHGGNACPNTPREQACAAPVKYMMHLYIKLSMIYPIRFIILSWSYFVIYWLPSSWKRYFKLFSILTSSTRLLTSTPKPQMISIWKSDQRCTAIIKNVTLCNFPNRNNFFLSFTRVTQDKK